MQQPKQERELVPARLRARREAERYSQRGLALAAGVPYSALANMEAGRVDDPKYTIITAIAAKLGVDPEYFFADVAVNVEQKPPAAS